MDKSKSPSHMALQRMAWIMLGGLAVIVVFALSVGAFPKSLEVAAAGLFVAGASALMGGLLGFLFGIPRVLQSEDGSESPSAVRGAAAANSQSITYRANTNLEQISDWLTKILVGVGLTQLTVLPDKLGRLATILAPAFGGAAYHGVLAVTIVLYFSVSGFLVGYLWTRLFLAGAFREADVAALGEKISELQRQMSQDARALSLVQQHLEPRSDAPEVAENDLREAIMQASPPAKTTIFYKAWGLRSDNWRDEEKKPIMERTIPIFQALAAADVRNEFHANHGQLGFALKDKRKPDWAQAERELSKAIEIRGDWERSGWLFYEFNRAICRIKLDEEVEKDKPSSAAARERILADLQAVASNDELFDRLRQEEAVENWAQRNDVDLDDLGS